MLDELEAAGLITLADKGLPGSTWEKIPYRNKPEPQKEANRAHAKLRAPGERPAQVIEDSPETPPLSLARRENSQRPSTFCSSAKPKEVGKNSVPVGLKA